MGVQNLKLKPHKRCVQKLPATLATHICFPNCTPTDPKQSEVATEGERELTTGTEERDRPNTIEWWVKSLEVLSQLTLDLIKPAIV